MQTILIQKKTHRKALFINRSRMPILPLLMLLSYAHHVYMHDTTPCQVVLTTEKNIVDRSSNVTLTCSVCNVSLATTVDLYLNQSVIAYLNLNTTNVLSPATQMRFKTYGDVTILMLTILNFQASSQGTYTCTNKDTHSTADLNLTLSEPVSNVKLTPPDEAVSAVEHLSFDYMKCISAPGRPAPIITWYADNRTPNDFTDDRDLTMYANSSTSNDMTTSVLTYTPSIGDNDTRIYCNVTNGYGNISSDHRTSLTIITYPPVPVIQYMRQPVNQISVLRQRNMTLSCSYGGVNSLNIMWITPSNSVVNSSVLAVTDLKSNQSGVYSCVTWQSVSPSYVEPMIINSSSSVSVNVLYPPEKINCIIGQERVSPGIIQVVRDEALQLNCSCDSNPSPVYTWLMPNGSEIGALLSLPSVQSIGNNSYTIRAVSNIQPTFDTNTLSVALEETYIFNIEFPPMVPVLYYEDLTEGLVQTNDINVLRGQHVSIRCQAASKPDPSYEWYVQGYKENNGETWNGTILNDTSIECNVSNTMNTTGRTHVTTSRTSSALIMANYPPENLTLTFRTCGTSVETNYLKVVEGHPVNGTCATVSKPSPTYYWTPDIYGNGEHFFINKANTSHHATYACNVEYILNTTFDGIINRTFQSTFVLEMLAPVKAYDINDTMCILNEMMSVTCAYKAGNPKLTSFEWFKLNTSHIISTDETLTITNIQRTDEGNYTCKVNNTLDPTGCAAEVVYDETTFYVDVQYAANITKYYAVGFEVKPAVAVVENQTISLICEADSDPIATLEIVNMSNGNEHSLTQSENNTITYDIEDTSCEYPTGVYQCKCRNVHNTEPEMREIKIVILCAPRASPFVPLITTVFGKINSSASLRFTVIASPPPSDSSSFVWRKKNGTDWVRLHTTDIIQIDIADDNLHTSLSISHLQHDDFETYCVSVRNQIGSAEQEFFIRAIGKPAVPEGFRVLVSQSGLTVLWKSGFNGGEIQQFVIGYKNEADANWTYTTVSGGETQVTLDRLVAGTTYNVKMYAENTVGKSEDTDILTVETQVKELEEENHGPIAAIVGSVVGVGGGMVIIIVLVIMLKRSKYGCPKKYQLQNDQSEGLGNYDYKLRDKDASLGSDFYSN